ncbi:hypothetical protein OAD66_07500 [Bacteroidia bacterium]|nr:hypothetical protein [Bacteroidia bacterium]MDB9882961.1 hypothetical protein [Bacteroidia bacterium]
MKFIKNKKTLTAVSVIAMLLSSCAVYTYSDKQKGENLSIDATEFASPLRTSDMFTQKAQEGSRGLITVPLLLKGADLAYEGIISVIAAKKENNKAEYKTALANQRFYSNVSQLGPMDPDYLSFSGFTIKRFATLDESTGLTFSLKTSLDTSKLEDIVAGSKFYLKMDSLEMNYTKLKYLDKKLVAPGTWFTKKDKILNLDINIEIVANWIDDEGIIHDNVSMGSFFYPIRNFDLAQLEEKPMILSNKAFTGSSYIIPRSTTFCFDKRGNRIKCYGLGDFNVLVTVSESKDNSFIEKTFYENQGSLIEAMKDQNISNLIGK